MRVWCKFGVCWRTEREGVETADGKNRRCVEVVMYRDVKKKGEERSEDDGKISVQDDKACVGECVERVKHAIVRLLLLLLAFLSRFLAVSCRRRRKVRRY